MENVGKFLVYLVYILWNLWYIWYIFETFGTFSGCVICDHLVYIFLVLVCFTKKNLAIMTYIYIHGCKIHRS
jgi:hypothetical protein